MNQYSAPWRPTTMPDASTSSDNDHISTHQVVTTSTPLMQRLPQLLRMAGATALLVAMYSFLVQGWQDSNDLLRYAMLLGHSVLLCGLGLASGHWLREPRGARLLTSLALVSVPANFAILGAFVYASVGAGSVPYPGVAQWQLHSTGLTAATVTVASLMLVPVVLLGFRVLARPLSGRLTLLFLAGNIALLLPVRDPTLIGAIALPLALLTLLQNERNRDEHLCARTPDGIMARLMQYLPLAVLLGRSLWLYEADAFLFTAGLLSVFLVMRQLSLLLPGQSILRGLLEVSSGVLTPLIGIGIGVLLDAWVVNELILPTCSLVTAALLWELSRRVEMAPSLYRSLAMLALLAGFVGNLYLFGGVDIALYCIGTGVALAVFGQQRQQLALFGTGLLIAASGLLYLLLRLLAEFDLGGWLSLALIGMLAIVLGSLLESRGGRLRPALGWLHQRFANWEV